MAWLNPQKASATCSIAGPVHLTVSKFPRNCPGAYGTSQRVDPNLPDLMEKNPSMKSEVDRLLPQARNALTFLGVFIGLCAVTVLAIWWIFRPAGNHDSRAVKGTNPDISVENVQTELRLRPPPATAPMSITFIDTPSS
jgi:hypothetical protein